MTNTFLLPTNHRKQHYSLPLTFLKQRPTLNTEQVVPEFSQFVGKVLRVVALISSCGSSDQKRMQLILKTHLSCCTITAADAFQHGWLLALNISKQQNGREILPLESLWDKRRQMKKESEESQSESKAVEVDIEDEFVPVGIHYK